MADAPSIPPRQLFTLAAVESVAALVAVARITLGASLENPVTLAWFVGTMMLGGAAVALFVVRTTMLGQQQPKLEGVDLVEARARVFGASLAVAVGAIGVAAVGPELLARLVGQAGG